MSNIIAIIIATLLIQSLIMTAIVLISNNNEDVAYICAVGIFGLFLILIIGFGKLVHNFFRYNYFKQSILLIKTTTDSDVTLNIITILYGIAKTIKQ